VGAIAQGAIIYAPEMLYPDEDPTSLAAVSTIRCQILTDNKQYTCRGVWCNGLTFGGLSAGELPTITLQFGVAYFEDQGSATFPDTTATAAGSPIPCSAGSLFYQTVGTTTRATKTPVSFAFNVDMQTVPIMGNAGNYARQSIIGARRTTSKATIDMVLDGEAVGTQYWADRFDQDAAVATFDHLLYSANSDVAIYCPKVKLIGMRPMQQDVDGLNRVAVQLEALTGPTTTDALTLSSWRIGMA